jgi:hypothetical protein
MNLAAAARWNALATAVLAALAGVAIWQAAVSGPLDTRDPPAPNTQPLTRPALKLADPDLASAHFGPLRAAQAVNWRVSDFPDAPVLTLLHTRIGPAPGRPTNGFQRAKDLAALHPANWNDRNTAAWTALEEKLRRDSPEFRAKLAELLNATAGSMSSVGRIGAMWNDDILAELQGYSAALGSPDATTPMRALAIASELPGSISGDAIALPTAAGPILIISLKTTLPLIPLCITAQDGSVIFMLTIGGASLPVCGMNSKGLALVRFAPENTGNNYIVGVGPDTLAVTRDALLRAAGAGLDPTGKDSSTTLGALLTSLADAKSYMLSRLATPGVVLAADANDAWRYEWKGAGNSEEASADLEFAQLGKDSSLAAGTAYSSPELRKAADASSASSPAAAKSSLQSDLAVASLSLSKGVSLTPERIAQLLASASPGEIRLALHPATGVIYLRAADWPTAAPAQQSPAPADAPSSGILALSLAPSPAILAITLRRASRLPWPAK